MRRKLKAAMVCLGGLVLALFIASAVPIATVEVRCGGASTATVPKPTPLVDEPGYRRAEGDSFMTYPEWSIVHAYRDLAAVVRAGSESDFDYVLPTRTFWTSLCQATRTARSVGPVTFDQRVTDYIIGLSFSAEMLVQGAYERTLGALTVRLRGPAKTPEDRYNERFLAEYASFLEQTPWYAYPFRRELTGLWRDVPWLWSNPLRSAERRVALSLQYGIKALYAIAIGTLAGYSPADLTIESVVSGPLSDRGAVTILRDLGQGRTLVRTARYEAFSDLLRTWSRDGVAVAEIAGNHHILTTVIARDGQQLDLPGAREIFRVAIQSRPGWTRVGLDTDVAHITDAIHAAESHGISFEHAYDY